MSTEQFVPRYSTPRRCLDWQATAHLRVLKTLAVVIAEGGLVGHRALWEEAARLYPLVVQGVLDEAGVSFAQVCAEAQQEQGIEITPNKLYGRGWNGAHGPDELDPLYEAVKAAHAHLKAR